MLRIGLYENVNETRTDTEVHNIVACPRLRGWLLKCVQSAVMGALLFFIRRRFR
jgi:hypothetical protein